MAENAQRDISSGLLNAGFLATCLRDNFPYKRSQLYQTKVTWQPVFKPVTSYDYGANEAEVLTVYDDYEVIGVNTRHSDYGLHVFLYFFKIDKT